MPPGFDGNSAAIGLCFWLEGGKKYQRLGPQEGREASEMPPLLSVASESLCKEAESNTHTLAHKHIHTHTRLLNHMLHFPQHSLTPPHNPSHSLFPSSTKTSSMHESCLETEGGNSDCSNWTSSLATTYTQPTSQAWLARHTDPIAAITSRLQQAQ